jgi:hypothetical protein
LNGSAPGGLNGSAQLTTATVQDDAAADTLTGSGGLDWFFVGTLDTVNKTGTEQVVNIA